MNQLAQLAVLRAQREGASFADARVERIWVEDLLVRNGELALSNAREELGLGVSVHAFGAVGFAALPLTHSHDEANANLAASRAIAAARELASAMRGPIEFAAEPAHRGEFHTPLEIDPFSVPLRERIELLRAAEQSLNDQRVRDRRAGETRLAVAGNDDQRWRDDVDGELHRCTRIVAAAAGDDHRAGTGADIGHMDAGIAGCIGETLR